VATYFVDARVNFKKETDNAASGKEITVPGLSQL
jgi:hypothetical protein